MLPLALCLWSLACHCLVAGRAQGPTGSDYPSGSEDTSGTGLAPNRDFFNPYPSLFSSLLSHSESEDALLSNQLNKQISPSDLSTLRYLSVITRHGSRSPTGTYPNDPYPYYNLTYWPDGIGQLTRFGKQQLYASGQLLRLRYNGFLNLNYFPNDNVIRANRFDRDFMSAACLLAGLYPPIGYQVWNPVILWQPIPIWEDPFDVAVLAEGGLCAAYDREQQKAIDELNKNSDKYQKLFAYLTKHTGEKVVNITDTVNIWDVLQLQAENGFKLPQWTRAVYPDKLAPLYSISFQTIVSGTPKMAQFTAGPVLKMISHQMMKKAQGTMKPNSLIFIEAAHDTTLQALFSGLGFQNPFPIETSAFMVFELHESTSEGLTVQIAYFNSSAHVKPNILDPPNCPYPCSLSSFVKFVNNFAPADWDAECNSVDSDNSTLTN